MAQQQVEVTNCDIHARDGETPFFWCGTNWHIKLDGYTIMPTEALRQQSLPDRNSVLESVQRAKLEAAIKATEYKYFGDYELSPDQWAAVDTLVEFAQDALKTDTALAEGSKP